MDQQHLPNELLLHVQQYVPSSGQPSLRRANKLFESSPLHERLFCEEPYTREIGKYLFEQRDMLRNDELKKYSDFSYEQIFVYFIFVVPSQRELRIVVSLDVQYPNLSYAVRNLMNPLESIQYIALHSIQDFYNMVQQYDCILSLSIMGEGEENWRMVRSILENRFIAAQSLVFRYRERFPLFDPDDCYIKLLAKHLSVDLTVLLQEKPHPYELLTPLKRIYTPEAVEELKQAIIDKFKVTKTQIYIKVRDFEMVRNWFRDWLSGFRSGDLV